MKTRLFLAALASSLLISTFMTANAADNYTLIGQTVSIVGSKDPETRDSLLLEVTPIESGVSIHLDKFELVGHKNLSITGIFITNEKGEITEWKDIVIKGAPAKAREITGCISKAGADIIMTGKAAGIIKFSIHLTAPALN